MANDHSPKNGIPILLIVAGFLAAAAASAPCFFSRSESVHAAVRGCQEDAAWHLRLVALAHSEGGWLGADFARALAEATPVLLGFLMTLWIAQSLPPCWRKRIHWIVALVSVATIVFGAFDAFQSARRDVRDIRLLAPVELLQSAGSGRVFLNSPALSAARLLAPDLVSRTPRATSSPPPLSPVLWREEDRREPFSAIILAVPLEDSRPLIEMLAASPEWNLSSITNQGLLYKRGKGGPSESTPPFLQKREAALHDAQTSMVMHFLGKNKIARELMSKALQSQPDEPLVLTQSAMLAASLGQWSLAKKNAESALKRDPTSTPARYLLALSLLESGNIPAAARESVRLSAQTPNEASCLWLSARISREANDPTAEIAALEALLALAKKQKEAPTIIHMHLGQAWAKRGFATQALENYSAALCGNLTPEQRRELENAKATILHRASPQ